MYINVDREDRKEKLRRRFWDSLKTDVKDTGQKRRVTGFVCLRTEVGERQWTLDLSLLSW
jgi:hypothetical protein